MSLSQGPPPFSRRQGPQEAPLGIRARRQELQKLLGGIAGQLQLDGSLKAPEPTAALAPSDLTPYGLLGRSMYYEFIGGLEEEQQKRFKNNGVRHGFRVISAVLRYAPATYKTYCQDHDRAQDLADLSAILHRSARTPNVFAYLDSMANNAYERGFGLKGVPPTYDMEPFVISDDTSQLHYQPNPELLHLTEAYVAPFTKGVDPYEFCPARGRFITKVWHAAIEKCLTQPQLFPHDLQD